MKGYACLNVLRNLYSVNFYGVYVAELVGRPPFVSTWDAYILSLQVHTQSPRLEWINLFTKDYIISSVLCIPYTPPECIKHEGYLGVECHAGTKVWKNNCNHAASAPFFSLHPSAPPPTPSPPPSWPLSWSPPVQWSIFGGKSCCGCSCQQPQYRQTCRRRLQLIYWCTTLFRSINVPKCYIYAWEQSKSTGFWKCTQS